MQKAGLRELTSSMRLKHAYSMSCQGMQSSCKCRSLASSRLVMSAWPWKAARERSPTLSSRSITACVSRASAPVKSSPFSSKCRPANAFLHVKQTLVDSPASVSADKYIEKHCREVKNFYLRVLRSTVKGLPFTVPSMRTLASLAPSLTTSALVRPREKPPCTCVQRYLVANIKHLAVFPMMSMADHLIIPASVFFPDVLLCVVKHLCKWIFKALWEMLRRRVTSALASERPVRAHRGAMTRLLFPEPLLWLPSSSMFLPVSTRAPLPCRLYITLSLHVHQTLDWRACTRSPTIADIPHMILVRRRVPVTVSRQKPYCPSSRSVLGRRPLTQGRQHV